MDTSKKGFIAPIITDSHHVLGSTGIPLPIIKSDGDWTNYLPVFESQLEQSFDSDGCTCYGTVNALETLEQFIYDTKPNYSRRYIYNVSNIYPPGSDPQTVITNIRGSGLIDETDLPDAVGSLMVFETPRPMTTALRIKGQEFLKRHQVGHQWIFGDNVV